MATKNPHKNVSVKKSAPVGKAGSKSATRRVEPHFMNHIGAAIGELDSAIKECSMSADCDFCQNQFLCRDMTLRAREFLEALPGLIAKH